MIRNGIQPDTVIRRGGKVLHMVRNASNIRFIDSLSFLAMPLSKVPPTFGLPSVKGYFAHYFNVPDSPPLSAYLQSKDILHIILMYPVPRTPAGILRSR